ncbi:hypothetical protein OAF62_01975 [Akkermansiaceae bacterium]|nr:hypothetical protein [Akkermansiaceae bacterium]
MGKRSACRPETDDVEGWKGFITAKLYKNAKGRYDESGVLLTYSMEEIQRFGLYFQLVEWLRVSKKTPDSGVVDTISKEAIKAIEQQIEASFKASENRAFKEQNREEIERIGTQRKKMVSGKIPQRIPQVRASVGNALLMLIKKTNELPKSQKEIKDFLIGHHGKFNTTDFCNALQFYEISDILEKGKPGP